MVKIAEATPELPHKPNRILLAYGSRKPVSLPHGVQANLSTPRQIKAIGGEAQLKQWLN